MNNIRHEGNENMFGYGMMELDGQPYGQLDFPDSLPVYAIVDFLGSASTFPAAELHDIDACEPSENADSKHRNAVRARFNSDKIPVDDIAQLLERKFNPAAATWNANYAGTLKDPDNTFLYVVTEQWEPSTTYHFLLDNRGYNGISAMNPVRALGDLHFTIEDNGEDLDKRCKDLGLSYARYIRDFVRNEFDYEP